MCYIFSCFGWALDFLQRTITFILACILSCIVALGIIVAVAAGIAYGYNYSMAEFLTFTRFDTTVYMRRGQFYERPDFDTAKDVVYARRSGGVGVGNSDDADLRRSGGKGPTWSQAHDTRKYAEVLTKYSRNRNLDKPLPLEDEEQLRREPPARRVSIAPNPHVVATTLMQNENYPKPMRSFRPLSTPSTYRFEMEVTNEYIGDGDLLYSDEKKRLSTKFFELPRTRPTLPSLVLTTEEVSSNSIPHYLEINTPTRTESYLDYKDEVAENNIVYKPV